MTVDLHHTGMLAAVAVPAAPVMASAPAALIEWANAAAAAHQLAVPLCRTDFVPAHFKGNENAATAAILYGAEAGLSPLQALQGIYVISGRPAMYARTMLAVTLGAGHDVRTIESTDARAVVEAQRRGSNHVEKVVVTIDQAKRAGWTSNKKYQTEPATMLLARAQSQACRRVAPDALLGMAYSAEELQDEQSQAPDAPKRTARRAPRAAAEPLIVAEPEMELEDEGPPSITEQQLKALHAGMTSLGMTDRTEALALLGELAGRDVESSKTLTRDEASCVVEKLAAMTGPADEPTLDEGDLPAVTQAGEG